MDKPSEIIAEKLTKAKTQSEEQVEFMLNRIILLDSEKEDIDEPIAKLDLAIQQQIDNVNKQIKNVAAAYQARIDDGCRTMKNWVQTGITTVALAPPFGGYTTVPVYTCVAVDPGLQQTKALHAIKYYDEPAAKDILDSTVSSFIGTCGIGSTHITIMSIAGTGSTQGVKIGQTITCDLPGVFPSTTTVVGFTTSVADLYPVGIGTSGADQVVDVLIVSNSTGVAVAATDQIEFDVLGFATSFNIPPVSMTASPFVPQTIGIMNTSIVGTGTYITYTNSSASSAKQSWNPYLNGVVIKTTPITEPVVGAGVTAYNIGSTDLPHKLVPSGGFPVTYTYVEADPGDTVTTSGINTYYQPIGVACSSALETNITNALNTLSTLETGLTVGINSIPPKIEVSNTLRAMRGKYSIQIWGIRQTLNELYKEENQFNEASVYINSPAVQAIIDA